MARFKFVISESHLDLISPTRVVADWINATSMVFEFRSPEWQGAEKWVHLSNPDYNGGTVYDINLVDDEISEERGMSLATGIWTIYLHGITTTEDGEVSQRFVTDTKTFQIIPSGVVNNQPLPVIEASVSEQIDAKATAALNARIVTASGEVDDNFGVPSVDVTLDGEDRLKNLHFSFHNMKGNGISRMVFDEDGAQTGFLTVYYDNGEVAEYDAIKKAILYMDHEFDQKIEEEFVAIRENIPQDASDLYNDSNVPGVKVKDALNNLDWRIPTDASHLVNDSAVEGETVKDALETLQDDIPEIPFIPSNASDIHNDSRVTGSTVEDALDTLLDAISGGEIVAPTSASEIANDSNIEGSTVKDALNEIGNIIGDVESLLSGI